MNMKTIAVLLVGIVAALNSVFGAPRVSDISARQRYPWNGLVDLKFTVTGTSGTKYDTSFIAKDMVGGTNITMVTVRNKEGASIDVTKEQLIPGTYNWVWDAAKDLPKDFACERVVVTGTAVEVDSHDKVQLWEGGPYWATTNIGAEKPLGISLGTADGWRVILSSLVSRFIQVMYRLKARSILICRKRGGLQKMVFLRLNMMRRICIGVLIGGCLHIRS